MRKCWTLLVLAVGLGMAGAGRADETAEPIQTWTTPSDPEEGCAPSCARPGHWQRLKGWLPHRPLFRRCRAEETAGPIKAWPTPSDHEGLCAPSCARPGHWHRLKEWLTYCPLSRPGPCGCHKACEPCGVPPLYIFFLCDRHRRGGPGCCGGEGGHP